MTEPAGVAQDYLPPLEPLYADWVIEMRGGGVHEITAYHATDRNGFLVLEDHQWRAVAEFNRAHILAIRHGKPS